MSRSDREPPRKVSGPRVPGAETKPAVGKIGKVEKKPKKRPKHPPKDEVERAERVTRQAVGAGLSSHAQKILRINRLKELIEPLTPSLIQVMSDIAHDKKVHPAVRLDAADRLLSRAYGKPKEHLEVTDPDAETNQDEVVKLLNNILESVGAPTLELSDQSKPPETGEAEGEG